MILLPSLGSAYYALAMLWVLPNPWQVVGTITIVDTLLGIWLGISTQQYHKAGADGVFTVNTADPEKDIFNVKFNVDPIELAGNKSVRLQVKRIDTPPRRAIV